MKIGSNIASMMANRRLGEASKEVSSALERLSTGMRINRASDDAAGLAISTKLRSDARLYTKALANVNDSISLLTIADSALETVSGVVTRLKELAIQANNGTFSQKQRAALNSEAQALRSEYNRILLSTEFNGIRPWATSGTLNTISTQVGITASGNVNSVLGSELFTTTGDGTFDPLQSLSNGDNARPVITADLNGDGLIDIISGDEGSQIRVRLSNGDGTFKNSSFATNGEVQGITLGDFDRDGKLDLVHTSNSVPGFVFFKGQGNGTCTNQANYVNSTDRGIASGDFNNDGVLDLVGNGAGTQLAVYIGNGNGTFGPASLFDSSGGGTLTVGFNIADFNGDGNLDLLANNNNGGGALNLLLGNGNGTFKARQNIASSQSLNASVGDLNSDGYVDVVSTSLAGNVHYLLGRGDGTFSADASFSPGFQGEGTALQDLNGDGNLDVVIMSGSASFMGVALGRGDGSFSATTNYAAHTVSNFSAQPIALGDFNNDGAIDIVAADSTAASLQLFFGNPVYTSTLQTIDLLTASGRSAALTMVTTALDNILAERAVVGSHLSRLASAANTLRGSQLEYEAAAARINDADVAEESARLVRNSILQQVALSVGAQANFEPQLALKLLKG